MQVKIKSDILINLFDYNFNGSFVIGTDLQPNWKIRFQMIIEW